MLYSVILLIFREECQKQVHGFSGAKFKKFSTSIEAWEFVNLPPSNSSSIADLNASKKKILS